LESKKDKIDARFTDYATDCFQDIRQILKNKRQDSLLYQVIIPSSQEHTVFAGLSGLLRTASLENPKVIGQIITIDPQDSIENLAKKIQENDHGHYIKYENEKRFIRVWEEQPVIPQDHEFRFKNRGIYLITGGLGGLGLIFAREILQQTKQATLILTGRSELSAEKQKILDELHQEIKPDNRHIIKYYKTDVSRSEQVRLLIESIQGDYGKLDGIIHSAGIIQDNFIYKKTTDEFKNVLASKVSGAINLDIATQNTALDFFVLFSSIAALGNIGQADYATANAFMDQFAHYRNELVTKNQRQGQTLSINWPFWEDGGMRVDEASKAMMKKLAGVLPMRTETGVKMLMHALSSSDSQVLVIEGFLTRVRDFLFDQSDIEKRQITSSRRELNTLRSEIETMLLQLMSTTLKLNPQDIEEIDPEAEFNEYGFDSITLTDFANQINHTCSLNLVPTIFFEFPTLSRLTDYLQNEFCTNFEEIFQKKGTRLKQPEIKNQVFVRPRTRFVVESAARPHEPIAIIGMSGCFPDAEDLEQFWDNLNREKDCISEIPKDRWDWQEIYGNPHREVNKTNIKWGGFINSAAEFDPLFFGISSREAELMDPQQRLLMIHVYKAMEDAGYSPKLISGSNTGIFVGMGSSGYHELIERSGIPIEGFSSTGLALSMGPNRMSYFLNLHGPSEPIETACSSSLVAIHRAVQAMNTENCDAAFAGGINIIATPDAHISFSKAGMLCEDGRCKTFSNQANGYVRGEGAGILYLKKLKLAEQDGDHIYGVIKGSAENHGGRANSLTAPNPTAQAEVLKTAYQKAGLDPKTVSYIEAHGTGTELGDPIEINGLKTAFKELYQQFGHDRVDEAHCGLGSVKTNIGHLELAAGVAGVIKVLLQFKHQTLLKTLHCDVVNPYIELDNSPFYIVSETKEWAGQSIPRRAGVSSFGFGGVNAHIVLEEYLKPNDEPQQANAGTAVIIPISAKTPEQLEEQVKNLLSYLRAQMPDNGSNQESLAYTLQVGREEMRERLGLIVHSINELKIKLESYLSKEINKEDFYRGQVKRDNSNDLSSDDELQSTIETCIKNSDYSKILDLWVKGITIDWNKFYNNRKPTRLALPTYPFSREKYWISSVANTPSESTDEIQSLRDKILSNMKELFAKATKFSTAIIDENEEFETYGIDSLLITRLNQDMTDIFGDISKTLFFEYQTLNDLTEYLIRDYPSQCLAWTGKASPDTQPATTTVEPVQQPRKNTDIDSESIAIIGLSGVYPQASDLDQFWQNLKTGLDCITEIPADRWSLEDFFCPDADKAVEQGLSYNKWGGFVESFAAFDPQFFNISPKETMSIDPQERLFLQMAWKALEDAGYTRTMLKEIYQQKVGVFAGITKTGFDLYGPKLWQEGRKYFPHTSFSSVANRLSFFLNVRGPSMPIDTMCSSSLTAIHEACEHIHRGDCELALAGGVNLYLHPANYIAMCAKQMLSKDGQCKSFGIGGNGFVPGEGVGVVLLKPLSSAIRDKDAIHAVIRATQVNHGGKTNGYTVPNPNAQTELIRGALDKAGINARHISYIEAHGTGTELGDPIEITGLTHAFRDDTQDLGFCKIGAAKSNIGHLEAAAGIAGVTKTILQMKHGKIVPSLHAKTVNPNISFEKTPFVVNQELTPWHRPQLDGIEIPRLAGISSFGAGGSNAHIILEEYQVPEKVASDAPAVIIPLSARTQAQLDQRVASLLTWLKTNSANLRSLAYTLQLGREAMEYRLGSVVSSIQELKDILTDYLSKKQATDRLYVGNTQQLNEATAPSEENQQQTIEKWIQQQELERLLKLWVKGVTVDWGQFYTTTPQRVHLPTYPFAQKRYWINDQPKQSDSTPFIRLRLPDDITPFERSSGKPSQISLTPLVTESGHHAASRQISDVLKPMDVLEDLKSAIPTEMPGLVPTLNRTGVMLERLTPCSESFVEFAGQCDGWVLDIGCAYGVATVAALEKGAHVFAVDMEQQHLDILLERINEKNRHQLVTEQGMLPDVDFEKHSFAAIHASRVIHFLSPEDVQKTIRKMADWLQPGGKLFLISDTPYTGYWKSKASEYEDRKAAGDLWPGYIDNVYREFSPQETMGGPPRINPLDPDTLRRECEYVGLEVEYAGFEGVDSGLNTPESKQHNMEQAGVIAIKTQMEK
jgi:acyl transferase domain-containing protein/NAD(P)-dependent dehydrogenase (short-subunit alcohol dehydrogenase family)/SAM-dependent methyltransferase